MGNGEFLTNRQVQDQVHTALEKSTAAQKPTRPPLPPGTQAIIEQTKADYTAVFGTPAPELTIESAIPLGNQPFSREPSVRIGVNEGSEEEEKLANALTARIASSNTAHVSQYTISKPPAPPVVRVLTAEEERQAQQDEEAHWDSAYGAQASRNGPM
ncbi:MAG: hypothetical protein NTZ55_00435 [Candidatus Roizmanbacteria bacterium]|nr:hypothetical protein [Candidatus Roizmanbacteria bacterium]